MEYKVEIEDSPYKDPIGIAGDLVLTVRRIPGSWYEGLFELIVNPHITHYEDEARVGPAVQRQRIEIGITGDTLVFPMNFPDGPKGVDCTVDGKNYTIECTGAGSQNLGEDGKYTTGPGQMFTTYDFTVRVL